MPTENFTPTLGDRERFWSKVDKSGECWMWTGGKDRKGYGKFSMGSQFKADGSRRNSMVSAHRFSYELVHGPIPAHDSFHGLCVLHSCDNPGCVKPDHLSLGTNKDNVHDMDRKGRRISKNARGEAHHGAILNELQVREIVAAHRERGISQAQLSKDYGVSTSTINHIFTGRLWAHLGLSNKSQRLGMTVVNAHDLVSMEIA